MLQQLELFNTSRALSEIGRYHHSSNRPDFPWLTWNWREPDQDHLNQKAVPAARLAWLLGQIARRPAWQQEHHFIVQNEFLAPNRRALNLWRLGLLWVDLDLCSPSHDARTVDFWTQKALHDCAELGIPEPSLIVWSGRGLHLKWTLEKGLPAQALPRWSAAMRCIGDKLRKLDWPVDEQARDVSRVLRIAGTMNPKPAADGSLVLRPVYVTHEGPDYDFDYLCEWVLPYSRQQVEEFRKSDEARIEAEKARRRAWERAKREYEKFDANRRRAGELLGGVMASAVMASQEAEQALHWRRLDVMRQVAARRGGIAPGQRNEWMWIAANSLAWGLGEAGKLWHELPQLVREIAPTLTIAEARNSASSVYQRLKKGGRDALYRMKTDTLVERLGLTPDEARGLRGAGHGTKNPGAMQLPKLRNLTFEEWRRKVKERMAAGGRYAADGRDESSLTEARQRAGVASGKARVQASEQDRATARLMRARGMSLREIAADLGVSHEAVRGWCEGVN